MSFFADSDDADCAQSVRSNASTVVAGNGSQRKSSYYDPNENDCEGSVHSNATTVVAGNTRRRIDSQSVPAKFGTGRRLRQPSSKYDDVQSPPLQIVTPTFIKTVITTERHRSHKTSGRSRGGHNNLQERSRYDIGPGLEPLPELPENRPSASSGAGNVPVPSSGGLVRLSLQKPMGIVFEPAQLLTDPPTGARVTELIPGGDAALTNLLREGDELLTLDDETVNKVSFDDIIDMIQNSNGGNGDEQHRISLLFRRPRMDNPNLDKYTIC